jgi:uncharacterized membrane protein YgcG
VTLAARVPAPLLRRGALAAAAVGVLLLPLAPALIAAGPPFPAPVNNQAVYDKAEVLTAAVIDRTEQQIDAIEARTGAEIVVYTQLVDIPRDKTEAESDAQKLMDQWGVGRKGFDDGLVILFDLNKSNPCHGQVQLYAGPGYQATYLSNDERQALYANDMLPLLEACDINGALTTAMDQIDANATPEHAAKLNGARQLNAVLGLVVAPAVLIGIVGFGLFRWRVAGKDPVYTDDASILMPAPPPGLTPAAGAAMRDGSVGRRSMTAASLDLAVRGLAAFKTEPPAAFTAKPGLGIYTGQAVTSDAAEQMRMERARRRPMDDATKYLLSVMTSAAGAASYLPADKLTAIGSHVPSFNKKLEKHLVAEGWYKAAPSAVVGRWGGYGFLVILAGVIAGIIGFNLPSSGILLVGIALGVAGVATMIIGSAMPSRTDAGAVIRAMLEAYRRTLEKTMAQARSMGDVATQAAIPLIESPDDAIAWGVALGLQDEVETVLQRATEDVTPDTVTRPYVPIWYMAPISSHSGGGQHGFAPGLMSSSPIPDFGGMMSALGTIGNAPSSSGSGSGGGGGGGFGGGGSGGGGGGAGGGF